MEQMREPVPTFTVGEDVLYYNQPYKVLTVATYCACCNRFLDEATYVIRGEDGSVIHKVAESDLQFPTR